MPHSNGMSTLCGIGKTHFYRIIHPEEKGRGRRDAFSLREAVSFLFVCAHPGCYVCHALPHPVNGTGCTRHIHLSPEEITQVEDERTTGIADEKCCCYYEEQNSYVFFSPIQRQGQGTSKPVRIIP